VRQHAFAAGVPSRTLLGSLQRSHDPVAGFGGRSGEEREAKDRESRERKRELGK